MNETSSSQRAGTGHSLSTPSDRRAAVHDSCLHAAEPSRRWLRRHVNLALVTILLLAITAPGAFGGTPEQVTLRSGRTYNLYGDILVPTDAGPGVAGALAGNRWPQANLFYEFDASVDNARRNDFRVWLDDWQAEAGTRFIESSTAPDRVLVQIASQIGCGSSVVGMAGGVQDLVISSAAGCWGPRVVLHELGHALGAIHEQQRSDRAAFVTITDHGIVANCGQATWDANYGIFPTTVATAYDYASIMHYPSTAHYTCNGNDVYAEIQVLQAQPAGAPEGSQNDCTTIAACQALLGAGSISARDGYGMAMRYGYRMQAEVVGNGSGSIVVDGNQEGCGTHCYLVTPDSLFIVHALPGADSVASFSGPCVGRECRFLPTGNATVTVRFSRKRSIAAAISALTRPRSERIFRSGFDPQG
jgi:hypothetical protein